MLRAAFLILLFPTPAFAYLDPGTGSIIAQVMIAAMLGLLFQAKMLWRRLKSFVTTIYDRRRKP